MKKNRIVIGIIVLLILLISGVFVGKIIYDRIVEQERASALAEEQRLEESTKQIILRSLNSWMLIPSRQTQKKVCGQQRKSTEYMFMKIT